MPVPEVEPENDEPNAILEGDKGIQGRQIYGLEYAKSKKDLECLMTGQIKT